MHDFITSGGLYLNPISYGIYAFVIVFIILYAILIMMPYADIRLKIAALAIIMVLIAGSLTFTMMIRVQDYEGVFKVDSIHYHLNKNNHEDYDEKQSSITVKNKDGIKSSFDYDGHQHIRKGDTIKIVLYGKPNQHPTISKNLDKYKIKSITKIN